MPQTKLLFSFLTQLRWSEITRRLEGQAAQGSGLETRSGQSSRRWLGLHGTRSCLLISIGPWTLTLEPQTRTRSLCFCHMSLRLCPGLEGTRVQVVGNSI